MYKKSEFQDLLVSQSDLVETSGALVKKSTHFSISYLTDFNKVVVDNGRKNIKIKINPEVAPNFTIFNEVVQHLQSRKLAEDPFGRYLNIGDSFEDLRSLAVLDKEGFVNISHQNGKVLVLQFWGTWAPHAIQELAFAQNFMSEKAIKWGESVAYVSIGFNDKKENLAKAVEDLGLKNLMNFSVHSTRREDINVLNYGLDSGPKTVIVDKWGKIRFIGQGSSVNIVELIEHYISEIHETIFSRDNFKTMKDYFSTMISLVADHRHLFLEFSFVMVKSSVFNFQGKRVSQNFVTPKLSVTYKQKYQNEAEKVLSKIFLALPEHNFSVLRNISNLKAAKNETIPRIQNALVISGCEKSVHLVTSNSYLLAPQNDFLLWGIKKAVFEPLSLPATSMNQALAFNQTLHHNPKPFGSVESAALIRTCNAISCANVGDLFVPIEAMNCSNIKKSISFSGESVIAIVFWGSWCQHSQPVMESLNTLFTKNAEAWGSTVKGFAVSIDPDATVWKKHIDTKGWTGIEQYRLEQGSPAFTAYGIQLVPQLTLVNRKGEIVFMGNPSSIKVEETINNVLKVDFETKKICSTEKEITREEYKNLKAYLNGVELRKFIEDTYIKTAQPLRPSLTIVLSKINEIDSTSSAKKMYKAIFALVILQKDFGLWKPYTDKIVACLSPDRFESFQIKLLEEVKK